MKTQTPSIITKKQFKTYGPRHISDYGPGAMITATVRHNDECGNGHNTFAITAQVVTPASKRRNDIEAGGCLHEDIARIFPELAPFIKWHLVSTDYPLHYVTNTLYHASDRDCWGLKAGEFRQHKSRGTYQNGGVEGVPNWELVVPDHNARDVYSHTKPEPVVCEWKASGRTGEGKARDLKAARSSAVWPDATDEELCQEPEQLKAALIARLPALMADFRRDVESLGFVY